MSKFQNKKHVLIVENGTDSLKKFESAETIKSNKIVLGGSFTEFDVENRNKRFYTAENFIPCMNSLLEKKKMLGVLYGEFDHPDVFDIAGKNASHAIESLVHNERSNRVDGQIALLTTHWGKEARAIINDGYPLFVSSRAAGITDANGNVALKELFTYDIVLDPGFATSKVSINESMGYGADLNVPYRIYEMNDSDVHKLFQDNKKETKTKMDLEQLQTTIADEMIKIEGQILAKLEQKLTTSPEELKSLKENYDFLKEELKNVSSYLDIFKQKYSVLISQNKSLTEQNKKLEKELNENTAYSNHISKKLKNIESHINTEIEERLSVTEKYAEHISKNTSANIAFSKDIAIDVKTLSKTLNEVKGFTEYVAKETELTQGLLENTTAELQKDDLYLTYIAEKVDGIKDYADKVVSKLKASTPVKEGVNDDIHSIESIYEFLGIEEEHEVLNNIENADEEQENNDATVSTEEPVIGDDNISAEGTPSVEPVATEFVETTTDEPLQVISTEEPVITDIQPETETTSVETSLLSAIVKVLATDETGVVIEVTPDNKIIIQKSGSDDTITCNNDEIEVIDESNISLEYVLSEIKKSKVLANQEPHFYMFLNEQQLKDFKALDNSTKESILLAMNESEYYTSQDVLSIIGNVVSNKAQTYEDKLLSNLPETIKESWNNLTQENKDSIIAESKYFPLITTSDITNFWNTRPFVKDAILEGKAVLIKEGAQITESDELNNDYINAFLKTASKFNLE